MSVDIRYAVDGTGVYFKYKGVVTGDTLFESVQSVLSDDRLEKLEFWFSDRTQVTKFEVSAEAAREIADICKIAMVRNSKMVLQ